MALSLDSAMRLLASLLLTPLLALASSCQARSSRPKAAAPDVRRVQPSPKAPARPVAVVPVLVLRPEPVVVEATDEEPVPCPEDPCPGGVCAIPEGR